MDYSYKCKKCGQMFTFNVANHSIEVIVNGKKMLRACRGEIVKIEADEKMSKIPIVKNDVSRH